MLAGLFICLSHPLSLSSPTTIIHSRRRSVVNSHRQVPRSRMQIIREASKRARCFVCKVSHFSLDAAVESERINSQDSASAVFRQSSGRRIFSTRLDPRRGKNPSAKIAGCTRIETDAATKGKITQTASQFRVASEIVDCVFIFIHARRDFLATAGVSRFPFDGDAQKIVPLSVFVFIGSTGTTQRRPALTFPFRTAPCRRAKS